MTTPLDTSSHETPFLDTELLERAADQAGDERFVHQVPTPPARSAAFPSGQTLPVTSGPALAGEEFFDPYFTNNPLLDVSGSKAATKLSKSFTAGEFARSGSVRFTRARIDPALVACMEAIREFLKAPVTILDGYYSYKHLMDLAKRRGTGVPPVNPHLSGRGAKFKAGGLSGLELAKAVVFACGKDTGIAIGDTSVAIYVKQLAPQVTSFIADGEKRERAIRTIRDYRQLYFSDAAMLAATRNDLHGVRQFAHGAIHTHQLRDETLLADVAFYRSDYVKAQRDKAGIAGRYDPKKPIDRQLRTEIVTKYIKPALADLPAPAAHGGGVPTTPKSERERATAQPDKPPVDVTGRYETVHADKSEELGKTMCINQAGTHVEVVISPVNSPGARATTERYTNRYYGDFDASGALRLFARGQGHDTLRLVRQGSNLGFEWKQGGSSGREIYKRVQDTPVLFEQPVGTFDPADRPLLSAYEWKPLLSKQIAFLRMFFGDSDRIGRLLKKFYEAEGSLQRWKEFEQGQAVKSFGATAQKWIRDPTRGFHVSDRILALFYIRHFMTQLRWRPSSSYPFLSALDWAQRAVSIVEYQCKHHPNRTGTTDAGALVDDLVDALGLKKGSDSAGHVHTYRVTLKLSGTLIGGLFGTITVEKTDDKKWPQGAETFKVWFVTLGAGLKWKKGKGARSIGPFKLGETYVGTASSNFYWLPNDFPGQARLALGEASVSAGAKVGADGGFLHILGRGGLPMLPVIFSEVDVSARGKLSAGAEIIAGLGRIRDKSFKDVVYPTQPDKTDYAVKYGMTGKSHFGFNSALLTPEARQALRVMSAHEIVALMSTDSVLKIDAHTDAVGSDADNQTLSDLRAQNTHQAMKDILGGKLQCKVEPKGHGEKEAKGAGETERNQDRRRVDLTLNGRLVLRLRA